MTSRINAEKCVCLHHREAAENQRNPETTYMGIKRLSADILRTTEAQEQGNKMFTELREKSLNIELITQHELFFKMRIPWVF